MVNANAMEGDLPKLLHLLKSVPENCGEALIPIRNLLNKIDSGHCDTSKGLSFLEVKNHLLLDYLIHLIVIIIKKCSGKPIVGTESVEGLVEIRTILERIKPIENKLKYQIDKLVKSAISGSLDASDPLLLRANPSNFITDRKSKQSDDDDEGEGEERTIGKSEEKYVPPRLAAVHYDGGGGVSDRDAPGSSKVSKLLERAKKRALSSSIMREIRQEYHDEPEEIVESGVSSSKRRRIGAQRQERVSYEEDTMTRVTVRKKQRHAERMAGSHNVLDELKGFGGSGADISAITATTLGELRGGSASLTQKKKKKKVSGKKNTKGKYKGKKFKRRKTI